jgi:(E)-4-hydroxy-3-methylbut-2-enyl-diphosphate synthase
MGRQRRKTLTVKIGEILMGSGQPVVIQAMTNTPTADVKKTVAQIKELADAGAELVRITINDEAAMRAVPKIKKELRDQGCAVPIIGDFHYNGHLLLSKYPECAKLLDKYRINPGNTVQKGKSSPFEMMIKTAVKYDKPVRIGINFGSLDQRLYNELMEENKELTKPKLVEDVIYEAMIRSALDSAEHAEKLGLGKDKIVLSVKMSKLQDMVRVNELLAKRCDYVLHLGLTEAGSGMAGAVASAAGLAILLQQGIGDTIRISLTPEPGAPRSLEVEACKNLLQAMGLRYFRPQVTSCPGCGRTNSKRFITLAKEVNDYIDQNIEDWKVKYPGVEKLTIAVMGCVVNGPGESKHADIGISLPGNQEEPICPVYIKGKLYKKLTGENVREQFLRILDGVVSKLVEK